MAAEHRQSRISGFQIGWERGWREGASTAISQVIGGPGAVVHNLRILYIPQGFQAIDDGIIEALNMSVRELHVAEATVMYEKASELKPDLVVVLNGLHVFPDNHLQQVDAIRALGIRTLIWFADDPYEIDNSAHVAPHYDIILTHELSAVELYRRQGCATVHYMPLGVHPGLFKPQLVGEEYESDVCFIGQGFWNRIELFDAIAAELSEYKVVIAGGLWERLNRYSELKSSIRSGWMPVEETIKFYNGAKIVINLHRTTEPGPDNKNSMNLPGRSINPRTYEIAACGALQLTDIREDLNVYYRAGLELDTFSTPVELQDKIRYYLNNAPARRMMAMRGLLRTLREHTFIHRVQHWLSLIKEVEV
ncbi:spore maturation protein [Paenibacillaceae bacterium]|nr:spore maturation protein [Paenibacillaceae bacterium]